MKYMNSIEYLFHSFQMKRFFTFWNSLELINTCTYTCIIPFLREKRLILKQNIAAMLVDRNIYIQEKMPKKGDH